MSQFHNYDHLSDDYLIFNNDLNFQVFSAFSYITKREWEMFLIFSALYILLTCMTDSQRSSWPLLAFDSFH